MKRNIFKTSNKYQEQIVLLAFFPSFLTLLIFIGFIFFGNPLISYAVLHVSSLGIETILEKFSWLIIVLMAVFFLIFMTTAFTISNNMVGAFGRIIYQLDEIIAGRSKKLISTRPRDTLTQDLLKRVNVLVKFYIDNKK